MSEFRPSRPDPAAPPPPHPDETHWGPAEAEESLWWLALAPTIWGVHLLATYITAAIWCEKVAPPGVRLGSLSWAVVAYTTLALLGVAGTAWHGLRRTQHGFGVPPHDYDSPGDRHRFLGLATLLLAGISAVAIVYAAVGVALVWTCE